MHRSFAAGSPQAIDAVRTIADSLGAPYAAPYSFGSVPALRRRAGAGRATTSCARHVPAVRVRQARRRAGRRRGDRRAAAVRCASACAGSASASSSAARTSTPPRSPPDCPALRSRRPLRVQAPHPPEAVHWSQSVRGSAWRKHESRCRLDRSRSWRRLQRRPRPATPDPGGPIPSGVRKTRPEAPTGSRPRRCSKPFVWSGPARSTT